MIESEVSLTIEEICNRSEDKTESEVNLLSPVFSVSLDSRLETSSLTAFDNEELCNSILSTLSTTSSSYMSMDEMEELEEQHDYTIRN